VPQPVQAEPVDQQTDETLLEPAPEFPADVP
jgi:hypothetical protein